MMIEIMLRPWEYDGYETAMRGSWPELKQSLQTLINDLELDIQFIGERVLVSFDDDDHTLNLKYPTIQCADSNACTELAQVITYKLGYLGIFEFKLEMNYTQAGGAATNIFNSVAHRASGMRDVDYTSPHDQRLKALKVPSHCVPFTLRCRQTKKVFGSFPVRIPDHLQHYGEYVDLPFFRTILVSEDLGQECEEGAYDLNLLDRLREYMRVIEFCHQRKIAFSSVTGDLLEEDLSYSAFVLKYGDESDRAAVQLPSSSIECNNKGARLFKQGHYRHAFVIFNRAQELAATEEGKAKAIYNCVSALMCMGQYQDALALGSQSYYVSLVNDKGWASRIKLNLKLLECRIELDQFDDPGEIAETCRGILEEKYRSHPRRVNILSAKLHIIKICLQGQVKNDPEGRIMLLEKAAAARDYTAALSVFQVFQNELSGVDPFPYATINTNFVRRVVEVRKDEKMAALLLAHNLGRREDIVSAGPEMQTLNQPSIFVTELVASDPDTDPLDAQTIKTALGLGPDQQCYVYRGPSSAAVYCNTTIPRSAERQYALVLGNALKSLGYQYADVDFRRHPSDKRYDILVTVPLDQLKLEFFLQVSNYCYGFSGSVSGALRSDSEHRFRLSSRDLEGSQGRSVGAVGQGGLFHSFSTHSSPAHSDSGGSPGGNPEEETIYKLCEAARKYLSRIFSKVIDRSDRGYQLDLDRGGACGLKEFKITFNNRALGPDGVLLLKAIFEEKRQGAPSIFGCCDAPVITVTSHEPVVAATPQLGGMR